MALVLANRVQETTTTTGTGTITLAGAVSGYQSFAAIGNTNTTYYTITSGTAWEVGIGTYTASGTTLSRDTVLSSSAAGAAITLAGTSTVFATYPAEKSVNYDASSNVGIGTSSPEYRLQVVGGYTGIGAVNTPTLAPSSTSGGAVFSWNRSVGGAETSITNPYNSATTSFEFLQKTGASTANTLYQMASTSHLFYISNTEKMRIDSSGNVGIGTSSPSTYGKLAVIGNIGASNYYVSDQATTQAGAFGFGNANGPAIEMYGSASGGAGIMLLKTANTERMRLSAAGGVSIGTTTDPGATNLLVAGTISGTVKAYKEFVTAASSSTAYTVDLSTANIFNISMTGNCTFTFTNPPASGTSFSFTLILKQDATGSRTATWPASVKYPNASTPTLTTTANKTDIFNFITVDGGTTYFGALSLANM